MVNDSTTGTAGLKVLSAVMTADGGGLTIDAESGSTLGAVGGDEIFDVSRDGYTAKFEVFTNGNYQLLSGGLNHVFDYLMQGQEQDLKLTYTVSDGCNTGSSYADICIMGVNHCPVLTVCTIDNIIQMPGNCGCGPKADLCASEQIKITTQIVRTKSLNAFSLMDSSSLTVAVLRSILLVRI